MSGLYSKVAAAACCPPAPFVRFLQVCSPYAEFLRAGHLGPDSKEAVSTLEMQKSWRMLYFDCAAVRCASNIAALLAKWLKFTVPHLA